MEKKYTALVLLIILLGAEASALQNLPSPLLLNKPKWDGLGVTAEINDYIEYTLVKIVAFIENYGLDPMALPDITEGFEVRPIFITYSAWLFLTNGHMSGLVNLQALNDQTISYFAKMVRLRLQFEAKDLDFVYRYRVRVMNIGPSGGIVGSLDRLTIRTDILIDFNNDELHLQEFSLRDVGRLRVRLTGNPLVDWLINPVMSVFIRIFDCIIIRVVENNILGAVNEAITLVNGGVRDILDHLETL